MASAQSYPNNNEPSGEDIVANILHVLSSYTEISPLLCRCHWEEGNKKMSWDPFISFVESIIDIDSGVATNSNFLWNWFVEYLPVLRCHRHENIGMGHGDMVQIMHAFMDTSRIDKLKPQPEDDLLWEAGLKLLKTHVFPNEESDIDDDDSDSRMSSDAIPPHELLRTVMDSYYCNDKYVELGELSLIEVEMPQERMYRLPTPLVMFILRSLLISRALETAEESVPDSADACKTTTIRWRRLKSMIDDTLSLFQRMLFEYIGKAVDMFEYRGRHNSFDFYPVEPEHIILIATWLYADQIFPSCHGLLHTLLWNDANTCNFKGAPSGIKVLETCYDSIRKLTSLLALEVALVDQEYTSPSQCTQCILKRIESKSTSDFFFLMKSAQKRIFGKGKSNDSTSDDDEEMYCPWNDKGPGFNGRGLTLEEDLLLYPSICKLYGTSDKDRSGSFYDDMAIAVMAYWKLLAQTKLKSGSSSFVLDPLPSPYSNYYQWSLLFPHVMTFLCASQASSTLERMDELEILSMSDDYLMGKHFTIFSLGLGMLHTLINTTTAIRPMHRHIKDQNPIAQWAHSEQCLEPTIASLLSHIVRISTLEASMGNKPSSEVHPALKYSSLDVLKMTESLLGFYSPAIQVVTLSSVCQRIKKKQERALLPKCLDFMRPIMMRMCNNMQQYNGMAVYVEAIGVMEKISRLLDNFLVDLDDVCSDSTSPLPKDVEEFMSSIETYSSVFAVIRLQRMWLSRCQVAVEGGISGDQGTLQGLLDGAVKWMDVCLIELKSFDSYLVRLIDFWQSSDPDERPPNWHWVFIMNLSLQDALAQPGK